MMKKKIWEKSFSKKNYRALLLAIHLKNDLPTDYLLRSNLQKRDPPLKKNLQILKKKDLVKISKNISMMKDRLINLPYAKKILYILIDSLLTKIFPLSLSYQAQRIFWKLAIKIKKRLPVWQWYLIWGVNLFPWIWKIDLDPLWIKFRIILMIMSVKGLQIICLCNNSLWLILLKDWLEIASKERNRS
jgi:hypothetical protein